MLNPSAAVSIPVTLFNGLNTELSPTDLPLGLSPDCRDVAFLPGQVFTRPSLRRYYTLGTTAQIVYTHSFRKRDGTIVRMDFDSRGGIWANGAQIGSTAPGSRFVCADANGRVFIAVSDGIKGVDVPLQYDGVNLDRVSQDGPAAPPTIMNYSLPAQAIQSLTRANGQVTLVTSAPHGLQEGFRFAVNGVADYTLTVSSIVINDATNYGFATITTTTPHGLQPSQQISIQGVQGVQVGGSVTHINVQNGVGTVTTAQPHGLLPGAQVIIHDTKDPDYQITVSAVTSATVFQWVSTGNSGDITSAGMTCTLLWPLSDGTVVQIASLPSTTSFTIPLTYSNGTWTTGTIDFPWDGLFNVESVPDASTLTYAQTGPDSTTNASGTMTPQGQVAPGLHKCCLLFQTRNGAILQPSPPVSFNASGNQYLRADGIALGPPNVVKRYLAFTLANGSRWFYLPLPAIISGQILGTATAIPDNTTTSVVLDFSDDALEAGIGIGPIDTPGNNLFQQVVLAPCLGFYAYESRLLAWGELNCVTNLLNMGFEGGVMANAPNAPLGWNINGSGNLVAGDYGYAWQPSAGASISQSFYQDSAGAPIAEPATQYTFRAWANGTVTATISSASTGFNATATITASGQQAEAVFSAKTPVVIPSDLLISFAGAAMDELRLIYTANPIRLAAHGSYVNNPEAFDDITGNFGEEDDPNPITGVVSLNGVLSFLTSGPNGNHYRVEDSSSGEPASWTIRRHGEKCGVLSPWAIATFETWFCWASDTGLRVFFGSEIEKMSQEVQSLWDSITPAARQFTVLANDPYTRRLHILVATNGAYVANSWWVMDYRELNTSQAIANSGTLRVVNSGRVITTDLTRKWCPWSPTMNYAGLIQAPDGSARMVFCGGTGGSLQDASYSASYTLLEGDLGGIDDDFGPFWNTSYYTTAFVPDVDTAAQYKLEPYRVLFTYMTQNVRGNGYLINQTQVGSLGNAGRALRPVSLTLDSSRDRGYGLEVPTERLAVRISAQPTLQQPSPANTPCGWSISALVLSVLQHPYAPVSGWNKAGV